MLARWILDFEHHALHARTSSRGSPRAPAGRAGSRIALSIRRTAPTRAAISSRAGRAQLAQRRKGLRVDAAPHTRAPLRGVHRQARGRQHACPPSARPSPPAATPRAARHEGERALAFGGAEQGVATGHREAVGLAHRGQHPDLARQVQVGRHAADHEHLLGVLLPEIRGIRHRHAEQLGRRPCMTPRKCSGPRAAPSRRSLSPSTCTKLEKPSG